MDNIPGIAGVGEKSALGLLEKYHDLDGIYAHLDEISGALHRKLSEGKEMAYFSKTLATIDLNVPLDVSLSECLIKMPFSHALREKFAELEFKSLITKNIFADEDEITSTEEAALEDLIRIIDILSAELSCRLTPLPELCAIASGSAETSVGRVFHILSIRLHEQISPSAGQCRSS